MVQAAHIDINSVTETLTDIESAFDTNFMVNKAQHYLMKLELVLKQVLVLAAIWKMLHIWLIWDLKKSVIMIMECGHGLLKKNIKGASKLKS